MTPEQLNYHKRLQPLYKRVMGEWKAGDRAYHKSSIFGEPLDSQIWAEDKRVEIVSVISESSVASFWHCKNEKGEERLLTDRDLLSETCLRCPLTIDSERPERGLWGMLNGHKLLETEDRGQSLCSAKSYTHYADDPTTAILKALCEQEGV